MSDQKWRWPKRIIPYTVGAEYSAGRKKMIQGAMQEWMDKTCIIFAEKGSAKAAEAGKLVCSGRVIVEKSQNIRCAHEKLFRCVLASL